MQFGLILTNVTLSKWSKKNKNIYDMITFMQGLKIKAKLNNIV